jgi:hypothetical protein
MGKPTIINRFGKLTGWNSITWNWFDRDVEGITQLAYSDTVDWENQYGANKMPIGEGEGNYEASASVTLKIEEVRAMEEALPQGVRLQDVSATVIVEYEYGGKIYKDVINNVRIRTRGIDVSQSDKSIEHQHELKVSHIDWNVKAA